MMDMKSMIARMDAIESKKVLKEDAAPPMALDSQVDEFIKGTAPEKIAAWMKHIKDFKDKGMYKAADDAQQAMKKVHPDYKKHSAPTPEFRGGIAKALMQDMGVDDQEVEEDGETQMPDIPRVPMQSSDGQVVTSSDGQPVMSGGPTEQPAAGGAAEPAPIQNGPTYPNGDPTQWDKTFDRATGAGEFGSEPQSQFAMPDDSEMGGGPAAATGGGGAVKPAPGIEPAKIQRFQELLKKAQGGMAKAAPAAGGKKPGGAAKPAANPAFTTITGQPNQQVGANTINPLGAAPESIQRSDDNILEMIRAIR